ncbi:DUF3108 domain-containing protein [Horticoccus luteus]|uniref:DUF3108 domain-containing protein n=1 Tax=Horticoccus luteus TaxID=2862869 RepID=A0A8F9TVQ3_9BACT|nr:DUF3108 domain-containing protein [Horticoccus luteus]QYM80129.1 DUF3108 domain-containing protein [Horticoccus luteus]
MIRAVSLLLVLAVCAVRASATEAPTLLQALHPGETFHYKVAWAVLPGAGEINIGVTNEALDGVKRLKVTTTTRTRGLAHVFMKFEATGESYFDEQTGRCVLLHEVSLVKKKVSEHFVTFDYDKRTALYAPGSWTSESRELSMPAGQPVDLITQLISTRAWNLQPGEQRDALVLFDDEFYELTIHAERYENISTPLGDFRTLVLVPRMEKTPPKGMFKRGSSVRVWISQDERHLPVRFEVEFKVGTGTATLVSYTPPTGATAAPAAQPAPASDAADADSRP